jgi:hypothetical protein
MQGNPFWKIVWIALAIVLNRVLFAYGYVELTSFSFYVTGQPEPPL